MAKLTLMVGTDSTWSIRAHLCLNIAGLDFEQEIINLSSKSAKEELRAVSETKLVPVLFDGALKIHDSLAITEYINELSIGALYPESVAERAIARSLCAELHAGFMILRSNCPFILGHGSTISMTAEIESELIRISQIWSTAQGQFMFKDVGAVDAFYAVLAYRLHAYGIQLSGKAGQYQQSLLDWPLFKATMIDVATW